MAIVGIHERTDLRGRVGVFENRIHAGILLGEMLAPYPLDNGIVLGIPAGGVPVGLAVADRLGLPFDVAVVSKITLPWDTEAGYGALAFDGTCQLNTALIAQLRLSEEQIAEGIRKTRSKVAGRSERFRGKRPFPEVKGRPVILVDDGLASGFTMKTALEALRNAGADTLIAAIPTAHDRAAADIADLTEGVFCVNIREGGRFAVAEAYRHWNDVSEDEVMDMLKQEDRRQKLPSRYEEEREDGTG
ncbi:MAG: phosphoribosyltransferase family protein [Desulfococcus multivorans]|uniref:phosphoribosyltransferase n=1 Tax=Desulfococcus sp. TaxID=2025834 RepID=UPI002A3F2C47|nr:phosphoribosyltransferase family protein [Desulfococcus multivorans]